VALQLFAVDKTSSHDILNQINVLYLYFGPRLRMCTFACTSC